MALPAGAVQIMGRGSHGSVVADLEAGWPWHCGAISRGTGGRGGGCG